MSAPFDPLKEAAKARAWREALRFTRPELSALTGFSVSAISDFESGHRRAGKKEAIGESSYIRYRMACRGAVSFTPDKEWSV